MDKPSTEYDTSVKPPKDIYLDMTWWNAHLKGHDAHDFLVGHIETMRQRQATRYINMRKLNSIYEWGFKASMYDTMDEVAVDEFTNAYNAAQNVVETVHSTICKSDVVLMPLTKGGGYMQRKRAKDLQKALEGVYAENNVEQLDEDTQMDVLVCGAGFAKVFSEFGRIKVEFVPADDITVDDAEGRYRKPRSMYQTTRMDRYVVLALYGGDEEWLHGDKETRRAKILNCKQAEQRNGSGVAVEHDQIDVHEAYHLPSGPDAGDGRMCIVIDGCTLVDKQRDRKNFPFAPCVPRPRRRSFWGLSMMHDLAPNQNEYERVTRKIQKAHKKMGGSHFIAPVGAQVNFREIDNDAGTFLDYVGQIPPREWLPGAVNPETYQYQASIPETMMRSRGVSPMSGSGEVPAGLQNASGKALTVFKDEGNGRLKPYFKTRDRWHVFLGQLIIEEARDVVEREGSYKVRYAGKKAIEELDWAKVLMDEEDFVLRVFPISGLSQDPAVKFDQLQQLRNSGDITTEQFKRLFDIPDLEAENEIDTADTDIIDMNLDIIATEGRYLSPEPFDNLELAKARAGKFYNVCRAKKGIPEAHLALLRDYIADCDALLKQAMPPPAPPMPPPGPPMGGPPVDPMMPPPMPPPMPDPSMMPPGGMPPPMAA